MLCLRNICMQKKWITVNRMAKFIVTFDPLDLKLLMQYTPKLENIVWTIRSVIRTMTFNL